MKRFWILKGIKFLFFGALFILGGGYIIMTLWNWLIPAIFSGHIGFAQAIGIFVLMRMLTGGFGRRGWGGRHHGAHQWKQRMESRMADMTPEEREQFKQRMKENWKCGGWNMPNDKKTTSESTAQ